MQQSSQTNTGSSWLRKLIVIAALAGAAIQIHIVDPGGTFDGRIYIPGKPLIERLAPDNELSFCMATTF
jgi:hypothetical protein